MALKISSGKKKEPYFTALYGPPSSGKSTFAADAPSPIFLDVERGTSHISTTRFDEIKSWDDIKAAIKFLKEEKHEHKTAVLDSVSAAEQMLIEKICKQEKVSTISEAFGGYGKGYEYAVAQWVDLLNDLRSLRDDRGMNVILIGHSDIKPFNDPNHPLPYDRYVLRLNEKAAAKIRESVDSMLFVNFEDSVFKVNKNDKKAKASGGDTRKIYTQRRAAYDAKDRLGLPPELSLSWAEFDRLAQLGQPDSIENIERDLVELMEKIQPEVKEKMKLAIEKANGDVTQLMKIRNHARTLGGE